jgi:hypothetical protein
MHDPSFPMYWELLSQKSETFFLKMGNMIPNKMETFRPFFRC